MRRTITRSAAWLAATAAAVALSWYGVRTVLRDTVFEPPRAPELAAQSVQGPAPQVGGTPARDATISATARPAPSSARPSASPSPSATTRTASPPSTGPASTQGVAPAAPADDVSGGTQSFEVKGGRASFSFGTDSASLIAATPNSGWAVKVWPGDRWLRVDFTKGDRTSSVFVTWNDHPPIGTTYES
ncbi:hypothetical protein [Yinghuangia seranimata]|uniref:hypothetical protein n=1 Tax=Yinghuangia seranimata TaxID=408067 RepID=UPI00248CA10C|nr:hypothetical protein [Yinghuangia seranimata]MDI2125875.1 hypothetical protein [Yinghuangia seranimata]